MRTGVSCSSPHVARLRTEGHADTDLPAPLSHAQRDHAVQAHERERECEQREHTEHRHAESLARDRINANRKKQGFEPVDEEIRTLEFAETLGVGSTKTKNAKIIPVE